MNMKHAIFKKKFLRQLRETRYALVSSGQHYRIIFQSFDEVPIFQFLVTGNTLFWFSSSLTL